MGKTSKKERLNFPVMIFCIIGVVLTIFGILLLKAGNFKLKVISAQGTVTNITESKTAEGTVENRSLVLSYIANNASYIANIPNYTEEVILGDTMTLYYDILSPESVDTKRSGWLGYLATIVGIILTVKTGPRFVRIIKDNYL